MIGSIQTVLIELDGQSGHAENFVNVRLADRLASGNMAGHMIKARITASDGNKLSAIPA